MLEAAHAEKLKGVDIIIGYVETHNRKETAELAEGFEVFRAKPTHKTTTVVEWTWMPFLARKPHVVIVDELAHTNAPGSRHKRYQDVQEILESGIHAYTHLNVSKSESRSDTVAQITESSSGNPAG
jgi:two-component system sensor histidine kinase KdpD